MSIFLNEVLIHIDTFAQDCLLFRTAALVSNVASESPILIEFPQWIIFMYTGMNCLYLNPLHPTCMMLVNKFSWIFKLSSQWIFTIISPWKQAWPLVWINYKDALCQAWMKLVLWITQENNDNDNIWQRRWRQKSDQKRLFEEADHGALTIIRTPSQPHPRYLLL